MHVVQQIRGCAWDAQAVRVVVSMFRRVCGVDLDSRYICNLINICKPQSASGMHDRAWHAVKHHQDVVALISPGYSVSGESSASAGPRFQ